MKRSYLIVLCTLVVFMGCERDFPIELKSGRPQLIVEAYINNELPDYTYVALSRSQDYYAPDLQNTPVSGATVTITEGELLPGNTYRWDRATTVQLKETRLQQTQDLLLPGLYFDPVLPTAPASALRGKPGKHYLLEIDVEGQQYSAITAMLYPTPIDSITVGDHFIDIDDDTTEERARLTVHFQDPDTIGNTRLYYWNSYNTRDNFGWGGLGTNRFIPGTDDLVNGQYMHLTFNNSFPIGDSVSFHLVNTERSVYNFWDSFNKARNNGGPFSTPVTLISNVQGEDVTGCFSGFSLSSKSAKVR